MKRIFSSLFLVLGLLSLAPRAFADGAIICTGDSTGACKGRQYCCYTGGESDGDKFCKNLGCYRGSTSSCPTAANVSSCGTRDVKASFMPAPEPMLSMASDDTIPWCI